MKKPMPNLKDIEAENHALNIIPRGDYEFEGTFRGYVENYPSDDRRQIQESFKAGWDARDKLDNEALKLAVEALEFYAEVSSWYINGSPKYLNHILDSDLQMANEPQPFSDQKGPFVGGKSARSALAEIRKLIGEK